MGNPQVARERLELPWIQKGAAGTSQNPMPSPIPFPGKNEPIPVQQPSQTMSQIPMSGRELPGEGATFSQSQAGPEMPMEAYEMPQSHPQPPAPPSKMPSYMPDLSEPQMPPMQRDISGKLGAIGNKYGTGPIPKTGSLGEISGGMMSRGGLSAGSGVHKIAAKMLSLLDNQTAKMAGSAMVGAAGNASSEKMKRLIQTIVTSSDPALEDYLAQESLPEYRALRMEASDGNASSSKPKPGSIPQ